MKNTPNALTVSEITRDIRNILEDRFGRISVIGEISNFKAHYSGHWYFNLKDENAVINCTMWKGFNSHVFFSPQDGMKVVVNGKITVYPPRGNYQIDIRSMVPAGVGELQAAFEKLKQKLSEEGLFDTKFKKKIPSIPRKIGIITAIDGAAIRDLVSVAERRFPIVELIVSPSKVQGFGAAESIVKSIEEMNKLRDIDVIILARGGGSIEDLWAFNEEIVARAIFKSQIPVISGVGHEVDFTIADYVADLRAPTPSVAMELATPDREDFIVFINEFLYNASENIAMLIENRKNRINSSLSSYGFRFLIEHIRNNYQRLDFSTTRNTQAIERKLLIAGSRLTLLRKNIDAHDISKSLKKGFALVRQNDKLISRFSNFDKELPATISFYDGDIRVKKS